MIDRVEFGRQVSDLYAHLYDLIYLRTHRLADVLLSASIPVQKQRGWRLHDLLLDTIAQLDPGPGAPPYSREWRRYRLMLGRFQNGQDPGTVMRDIAVSKRQYYREQEAALDAAAELLWEQYIAQTPAASVNKESGEPSHVEMLRLEAARSAQTGRYTQPGEVIQGVLDLLEERRRQRRLTLDLTLPNSLPMVRAARSLLRQLLLGVIGYLIERAEQSHLCVVAEVVAEMLYIRATIVSPEGLRAATSAEVVERLTAFTEMAVLGGGELAAIQSEAGVIGFEIALPVKAHRVVLAVDDNEDVLELYRRYLTPYGYDVLTATTAEQAIELATELQPFAITLDLMLPGQDGWDALQALLNRPVTQHIPVIVCSVLKQKELALALGATAFLEKPVTEQGLLAVLRTVEAT